MNQQGPPPPQQGQQPPRREREPGTVIEIEQNHGLRTYIMDEQMRPRKSPVILIFTHLHNNVSVIAATEIAKLAKLTNDRPMVIRADCLFDFEACDLFKNHLETQKDTYPLVLMVTGKKTHVYDGPIIAQDIYDNFVQGFKFDKFGTLGDTPGMFTQQIIEAGKKYIVSQMGDRKGADEHKDPVHVIYFEKAFGMMFADVIAFIWFHTGLNFWTKNSKITVFIAIFLVPCFIALIHLLEVCFFSKKKCEPQSGCCEKQTSK